MKVYRLAPGATDDLFSVYVQGYDLFGQRQADAYQQGLVQLFERLADYPYLGRELSEFSPPVRVIPHGSHVVIYEVIDAGVIILRVRHGHEDWTSSPTGDHP